MKAVGFIFPSVCLTCKFYYSVSGPDFCRELASPDLYITSNFLYLVCRPWIWNRNFGANWRVWMFPEAKTFKVSYYDWSCAFFIVLPSFAVKQTKQAKQPSLVVFFDHQLLDFYWFACADCRKPVKNSLLC